MYFNEEPFYTTKGREGTGLGMMVVLKIIDLMNGKMAVTSNINKGTQFKICFPRSMWSVSLKLTELSLVEEELYFRIEVGPYPKNLQFN